MAFDHVVSIGGDCDPAHHVRRHYDIRVSMPTDWLILPFAGVILLFNEGFSDFIHLYRLRCGVLPGMPSSAARAA